MYKLAINRPITTIMFALALVFFGLVGKSKMPASLYPNVDFPTVVVTTFYKGASADIVESKVSDKIEEAISGISSLEFVSSDNSKGVSVVVAQFKLDKSVDEAVNDVRDKVSSVALSSEVDKPIVDKFSVSAAPVITLFLSADANNTQSLMTYADEVIKPKLQRLEGVGGVDIAGFRKKTIKIYPDTTALAKYGVDLNELASKINVENIKRDGGRIVENKKEWLISVDADARNIRQLENIKIKDGVMLGDVARIDSTIADERSYANLNGKSGVIIQVKKITGANEIKIADMVKTELPQLQALSKEFKLSMLFDSTTFIKNTLSSVQFDLILGCFLASFVVFLFLRNTTLTVVAAISLPISILGVLAILGATGQTLNLLTLTALTLAIGIIVDDAIVVIENIYKKLESGMPRVEAAREGVSEISFSIIAISAMLLAVFIPIANMSGVVGKFFVSFGLTIVGAVIVSYVVAITLIPMISSLVANPKHSKFYYKTEYIFEALEVRYKKYLKLLLEYKKTTLFSALGIFILSMVLSSGLGMVFMPKEDKSQFDISIKTKPGISMEEMKKRVLEIQKIITSFPETEYCSLLIGTGSEKKIHEASMTVRLKPIDDRKRSQAEIMEDTRKKLASIKEMTINVTEAADIGAGEINTPFLMILKAKDAAIAEASATKLTEYLKTVKGTNSIQSNIQPKTPEISVKILTENAARLGVNASEAANIIANAFSGETAVSYLRENGKEYDITVRLSDQDRHDKDAISRLMIRNSKGDMILLSSVAEITDGESPTTIKRRDRQKQVLVGSDLKDGLALDALIKEVETNKDKWLLQGVAYELDGDAKYMGETNDAFGVAIVAATIMIYLILASLYESPLQPLVIMSALPLSFTGAFIGLFIFGMNMSLFSMMGLMLLLGLVGKNSTLVVDAANRLRESGKELNEAIIEAGVSRLRPILMTTTAMCFGMLPLALSVGEGSGVKAPMGVTVIFGLLLSTLLSLFVVPAFYKIIAPLDDKLRKLYKH